MTFFEVVIHVTSFRGECVHARHACVFMSQHLRVLTQLEGEEEDAKEAREDGILRDVGELRVPASDLGKVGALSGPQGGGGQTHDDGRRHHGGPHRVAVGRHKHDVADEADWDSPFVSDGVRDEFREEETGDNEGGIEDTGVDHSHPIDAVQTRLEATEALEGIEGHEEGDADEDDVLEDATFLGRHVHNSVDGDVSVLAAVHARRHPICRHRPMSLCSLCRRRHVVSRTMKSVECVTSDSVNSYLQQ